MSNKAECPACKAYTSGVFDALYGEHDGCPSCGLPGETMREVMKARKSVADKELVQRCESAILRAGRAEADLLKLRVRLYEIRAMFATWETEDPLSGEEWQQAWNERGW